MLTELCDLKQHCFMQSALIKLAYLTGNSRINVEEPNDKRRRIRFEVIMSCVCVEK